MGSVTWFFSLLRRIFELSEYIQIKSGGICGWFSSLCLCFAAYISSSNICDSTSQITYGDTQCLSFWSPRAQTSRRVSHVSFLCSWAYVSFSDIFKIGIGFANGSPSSLCLCLAAYISSIDSFDSKNQNSREPFHVICMAPSTQRAEKGYDVSVLCFSVYMNSLNIYSKSMGRV
jgi:hypothetical protein